MLINIIDRVRLAFKKDKTLASALQDILGFYPHKLEYYRIALAHKSLAYKNRKGHPANNERLEFLGDAVIETVVSDIVFHRYPNKREGFLTCTRSKLVQRSSLNRLAHDIGLHRLVKTAGLNNTHNNNILGNAFEAIVGAIYLDRGYGFCKWFIEKRIVGRLVDIDGVAQKEVNFKSKLLEWTQKNRIECRYDSEEHDDTESSSPIFESTITIEGLVAGSGRGYSKKESQQIAARDALIRLNRDPGFTDSIYRSKEKRTAMEAEEVCALPPIEEIEAAPVARQPKMPTSRHAKPAPQRRTAANAAPGTTAQPAETGKKTGAEKKAGPGKDKAGTDGQKAVAAERKAAAKAKRSAAQSANTDAGAGKVDTGADAAVAGTGADTTTPGKSRRSRSRRRSRGGKERGAAADGVPEVTDDGTGTPVGTILKTPLPALPRPVAEAPAGTPDTTANRSTDKPGKADDSATGAANGRAAAEKAAAGTAPDGDKSADADTGTANSDADARRDRKPRRSRNRKPRPAADGETAATANEGAAAPQTVKRPERKGNRKPVDPAAAAEATAKAAAAREAIIAQAEADAFERHADD